MIWATSQSPTPKHGETRTSVRRAWVPKRVVNSIIWLEQYERLEVWQSRQITADVMGQAKVFEIGEWVKVAEIVVKWTRA